MEGKKEEVEAIRTMASPQPPQASCSSATTMVASATSPPSLSSSPSHDFTFTISLYPSPPKGPNKATHKSRIPATAIDLAPADDIFFHGHLLPLRLLTRPPFSPRRSAEGLTISFNNTSTSTADQIQEKPIHEPAKRTFEPKERVKTAKSFSSIVAALAKWRREDIENMDMDTDTDKDKDKDKKRDAKKKKFDMKRTLKRYANLVETLLFSKGGREKRDLRQRPYSFSGVSSNWNKGGGENCAGGGRGEDWRRRGKKRWGEFSAPASMRTSPTNSGLLVAPPNLGSSEDSTMEELQSAIQAAIAHCKNSMNSKEERCKC